MGLKTSIDVKTDQWPKERLLTILGQVHLKLLEICMVTVIRRYWVVCNVLAADVRGSEEGSRKGWMQSSITNVKAMMSRVAEQVSQVALFLSLSLSHSFSLARSPWM